MSLYKTILTKRLLISKFYSDMFANNLKYLRAKNNLSQVQMAEELQINRSTYKEYEYGVNEPGFKFLTDLSERFAIRIDDLIKGDLEKIEVANLKLKKRTSIGNDNLRVLAVSVDKEEKEHIEFVPAKARAGYTEGYHDVDFLKELPKFNLPGVHSGTYRAFEIKGDSMPPISHGSIVIGKYVESRRQIVNFKTYVLVTETEGVVYKRVINKVRKKGQLILLSDNHVNYEPYTIDIADVKEAWEYYAHISFDDSGINKLVKDHLAGVLPDYDKNDTKYSQLKINKL